MARKKDVKRPVPQPAGPSQEDVQKLAQDLTEWAKNLPEKQQRLLHQLLSRAASRRMPIGQGRYKMDAPAIDETNLERAAADALQASSPSGTPRSYGPGWSQWLLTGWGWFRSQSVSTKSSK